MKITHHINNNINTYSKVSLLLGYLSAIAASLFFDVLWNNAYYHLIELSFALYLSGFYLLCKSQTKRYSKFWQTITLIVLLSALSTLIDEVFYSATKVELNDLVRFISIIVFSISYKYKLAPKKKNGRRSD